MSPTTTATPIVTDQPALSISVREAPGDIFVAEVRHDPQGAHHAMLIKAVEQLIADSLLEKIEEDTPIDEGSCAVFQLTNWMYALLPDGEKNSTFLCGYVAGILFLAVAQAQSA